MKIATFIPVIPVHLLFKKQADFVLLIGSWLLEPLECKTHYSPDVKPHVPSENNNSDNNNNDNFAAF